MVFHLDALLNAKLLFGAALNPRLAFVDVMTHTMILREYDCIFPLKLAAKQLK